MTVPEDGPPGAWTANAQASDCEGITSVGFTVTAKNDSGNGGPSVPGNSSVPPSDGGNADGGGSANVEVGGVTADRELPSGAVENAALNLGGGADVKGSTSSGRVDASKLAWTGSNVRIPVTIGITLLMVGALLLLRSRRSAEALR